MQHLELSSPIGYDQDNDPEDISSTATALVALGRWGALDAARSGQHDDAFDREIRSYQSDNELDPDGVLLPSGPTQSALNRSLTANPLGPSLLDAAHSGERQEQAITEVLRPPRNAVPLAREANPAAQFNFGQDMAPVDRARSRDADELPRISERTHRNMLQAAKIQNRAATVLDAWLGDFAAKSLSAPDKERIMKEQGHKYVPDPMGRVGEGDWIDPSGRRLELGDVARITSAATQFDSPRRFPSEVGPYSQTGTSDRFRSPANSVMRGSSDRLANDLRAASRRVAEGEQGIRLRLASLHNAVGEFELEREARRINGAIREATVANALRFRATTPDEIADIVSRAVEDRALGPQGDRSRIRDMLVAAANTATSPDARLHARGLLAVYDGEREEAIEQGRRRPFEKADRAIAGFTADQSGQITWSISLSDDDEDGDEFEIESASDDPNDPSTKKRRGMQNPEIREKVEEGNRRHKEQLKPYVEGKGPGWYYAKPTYDPRMGTYVYPDVTTPRERTMDMKPPGEAAKKAGEKQRKRYERITGKSSRIIPYREFRLPPRPPTAADEPGGLKVPPRSSPAPSGTPSNSSPRAASPPSSPNSGTVGPIGGGGLYPKLRGPHYLNRMWEFLE